MDGMVGRRGEIAGAGEGQGKKCFSPILLFNSFNLSNENNQQEIIVSSGLIGKSIKKSINANNVVH